MCITASPRSENGQSARHTLYEGALGLSRNMSSCLQLSEQLALVAFAEFSERVLRGPGNEQPAY